LADNPFYTKRFAFYVGRRCRSSPIRDVARELHLDWKTVKILEMEYMREQLRRAGTPAPTIIGIDEIAIRKLREKAYPALLIATQDKDPEVARRAEEVLRKLRDTVPEEDLEFHKQDVVQTEDSKIAGRIEMEELKIRGGAPGETPVKVADVRSLRSMAVEDEDNVAVAPGPGNLKALENQVGKTFKFKVTGAVNGSVWGTDVYTTDSTLATVAVHAGILKAGQTGVVKVKIVTPPAQFQGSTKNGVTTGPWNAYPGAYQVSK
jgi:hypothetical protein